MTERNIKTNIEKEVEVWETMNSNLEFDPNSLFSTEILAKFQPKLKNLKITISIF